MRDRTDDLKTIEDEVRAWRDTDWIAMLNAELGPARGRRYEPILSFADAKFALRELLKEHKEELAEAQRI